jgi:anti-anti-sigma factor
MRQGQSWKNVLVKNRAIEGAGVLGGRMNVAADLNRQGETCNNQKSSRSTRGRITVPSMKRAAQLRISEKIEGQDRILSFQGSADILSMPSVQELLSRYSREKIRLLLVDLSETEFINSPVWAVITLYARKQRDQSRVAIVGMSERIKGSFEMMGLQKELLTFADVETARRELLE